MMKDADDKLEHIKDAKPVTARSGTSYGHRQIGWRVFVFYKHFCPSKKLQEGPRTVHYLANLEYCSKHTCTPPVGLQLL
eukprot:6202309-Pleurochrysis_carterae.AAC.2